MSDRAAIAKLTAKIEQLTQQVETQAETIRAQNIKLLRLQREAKARAENFVEPDDLSKPNAGKRGAWTLDMQEGNWEEWHGGNQ